MQVSWAVDEGTQGQNNVQPGSAAHLFGVNNSVVEQLQASLTGGVRLVSNDVYAVGENVQLRGPLYGGGGNATFAQALWPAPGGGGGPAPEPLTFSEWSNVISLNAGVQNLPVVNLTGTTTATHWHLEWDKYTSFVAARYLIQYKQQDSNVWLELASVPATDAARNSYSHQHLNAPGIEELDVYNFRVRAERGGE